MLTKTFAPAKPNRELSAGGGNIPTFPEAASHPQTRTSIFGPNVHIDALDLTIRLGGKWYRTYGAAPCPVCQHESNRTQNALTLADGRNSRLLAHCKKSGCDFRDILSAVGLMPGDYHAPDPAEIARRDAEARKDVQRKADQAKQNWCETQPIEGTGAEAYLCGRGITCPLPDTLRFHGACWHGPSAKRFSALVALVEGGEGFAVHRTYLRPDGTGKADIDPDKMMLGRVAGGAARLTEGPGPLVVAEGGIETALSLASGLLRGPAAIRATLSTSGMRSLRLPIKSGSMIVATDGDAPGREAGYVLATRAHALGWDVSMLPAPEGRDWNDVLRGAK